MTSVLLVSTCPLWICKFLQCKLGDTIIGLVFHPTRWLVRFSLILICLSFQILNLSRTLSSWGSGNYRTSAPLLYEVASHVKQLPFRPLLSLYFVTLQGFTLHVFLSTLKYYCDYLTIVFHRYHIWTRLWVFKLHLYEHRFPHASHLYGFSPVWTRRCLFKSVLCVNRATHVSHLYGFSPAWIRLCAFKLHFCENLFPHAWHLNGFSPVCVRKWTTKWWLRENRAPQVSHL